MTERACRAAMPARGILRCSASPYGHRCIATDDGHIQHPCACGAVFALRDGGDAASSEAAGDARPFGELRDSGLLWLINRVVFHPRGFALALVASDGEATGWKLLGDGSEVWRFDDDEDGLYAAVKATLELAALRNRPPRQSDPNEPLADWERELLEQQDTDRRTR